MGYSNNHGMESLAYETSKLSKTFTLGRGRQSRNMMSLYTSGKEKTYLS